MGRRYFPTYPSCCASAPGAGSRYIAVEGSGRAVTARQNFICTRGSPISELNVMGFGAPWAAHPHLQAKLHPSPLGTWGAPEDRGGERGAVWPAGRGALVKEYFRVGAGRGEGAVNAAAGWRSRERERRFSFLLKGEN